MADTTKTKVLNINTTQSEKNVKSLKTQLRELREQLAGLERGTVEYDKVAQQLADTTQKQIEIQEAAKYSNRDIGQTLSNLTNVAAGVVGAISSVNSVMVLMGADSEEAQEAMKKIQALMAVVQGLGAIDTATKALKGLTVAFKDFNTVKGANAAVTAGAATAELAEAGALADNTIKMHKNNEEAKEFNRLNEEGAEVTKKSTDEINKETTSILARTEAQRGNIEAAKKYKEELEKLNEIQASDVSNAKNLGFGKALDEYEKRIKNAQAMLEYHSQGMTNETKAMYEQQIKDYSSAITRMMSTSVTTTDDIMVAVEGSLDNLIAASKGSFEDMEEEVIYFNELIKGLPFDEAAKKAEEANDLFERCLTSFRESAMAGEEGMEDAIRDFTDLQENFKTETDATLATLKEREIQQAQLKKQIVETIEAENAETAAVNANTAAKQKNAEATGEVAASETALGNTTKKNEPILRKAWAGLAKGIKNAAKAIKGFVKANPILAAITGTIALLTAAWKTIDHFVAKAKKEYREAVELQNRFNTEFNTQKVDMDALLRMYQSETTTLKEKESLAKEINKLAGDEVITKNELTGVLEINNGKLAEYNERLRTSIQLDYHKQQIQELMAKEEEARNNAVNERTKAIGKLFRTEKGYLKEAADLVAEQEKHWKEIEKLTSGTVKNIDATSRTTKTTSGGSGIVRTFKEIFKDIQAEFRKVVQDFFDTRELRMRYNGVYTETDALLLRIEKLIKSKGLGDKLGEQLKTALGKGGEGIRNYDITLDFIFSNDAFNELEKKLIDEQETLSKMLQKKSGGAALDKELKAQKEIVSELETQLKDMTELANAVQDYADAWDKAAQKNKELTDNISRYNEELKIQREATIAERGNNQTALAEEQVKSAQLNLEYAKKQFEQDKKHRDLLQEKFEQEKNNQKVYESYIEYRQKTFESEKAYYEAIAQLDNALYSQRQVKLEEERNTMRKENEELERLTSNYNNFLGFMHFDDYNTPVLQIQTQIEGIERLIEQTKNYYDTLDELYKDDSDKLLSLTAERNAAMSQLQQEQAENEIALEQAKTNRKIEIQRTYVNLYQSLTSQISGLLSAEMQNYDENSFKYKKLRYAQGVIDVSSGVLSAFMSGIQSGVPAPWNLGVAAAMAGITLATGIENLKAIKNGTLANTPSAQTVDFGTYDTLSYQQNADIISSIRDQKVYVTEQDISSTQNRVRVTETNAVF